MRLRSFNKVRQWGDLNWASQLQPSGLTDLLNCSTSYLLQSNYCQAVSTWSTLTVLLIFGFNKCICFLAIHIKCYWRYRSLLKSRSRIHLWVSSNISIRQISINYLERGRAPEIPQKRISSKKPFLTLECLPQRALIQNVNQKSAFLSNSNIAFNYYHIQRRVYN